MLPALLKLGPLTLHTYGALTALGFFLGYQWMVRQGRGIGFSEDVVARLAWTVLLSGLLGARMLFVLFNLGYYAKAPLDVLKIWEGGLVWYGALGFGLLGGLVVVKRHGLRVWDALDLVAPAAALGHAVGRLGCFAAGCCYGRASEAPWAVTFTHPESLAPLHAALHPTQLYEALGNGLIFLGLWAFSKKKPRPGAARPGTIALTYVIAYALLRLAVEFFRADDRGPVALGLTTTQWIALAALLAGGLGLAFRRGRA